MGSCAPSVAARDPSRARTFATKHGIPKVHESYDALLTDDEIDAVYTHSRTACTACGRCGHWPRESTCCAKSPSPPTRPGGRRVAAADASGLVVMEAFHWRYHPMAARMLEVIAGGELGDVLRIDAGLCFPLPMFKDIRWQLSLAGGALWTPGVTGPHGADSGRHRTDGGPGHGTAAYAGRGPPHGGRVLVCRRA